MSRPNGLQILNDPIKVYKAYAQRLKHTFTTQKVAGETYLVFATKVNKQPDTTNTLDLLSDDDMVNDICRVYQVPPPYQQLSEQIVESIKKDE